MNVEIDKIGRVGRRKGVKKGKGRNSIMSRNTRVATKQKRLMDVNESVKYPREDHQHS